VYVFLSNRVLPQRWQHQAGRLPGAPQIHDVIYKSIINFQTLNASIKQ
jgi:hypothetical protein